MTTPLPRYVDKLASAEGPATRWLRLNAAAISREHAAMIAEIQAQKKEQVR